MKYVITPQYTIYSSTTVDLGDRTWEDVESFFVKWNEIHIFFKDGTKDTHRLEDLSPETIDHKYPSKTSITEADEDGDDSGVEVDEA